MSHHMGTLNLRWRIVLATFALIALAMGPLPGGCEPQTGGNGLSDSERCLPEGCSAGEDCYSGRCLTPEQAADEGLTEADITG